jgi:hypothetical protein
MIGSRTAAQWYALVVGIALLAIGGVDLAGSLASAIFGADGFWGRTHVTVFSLDGGRALLHLAVGLAGLACWRRPVSARVFALTAGVAYAALAAWGLLLETQVLWALHTRLADDVLHGVIGLAGVVVGAVSPLHLQPGTPRAQLDYA